MKSRAWTSDITMETHEFILVQNAHTILLYIMAFGQSPSRVDTCLYSSLTSMDFSSFPLSNYFLSLCDYSRVCARQ